MVQAAARQNLAALIDATAQARDVFVVNRIVVREHRLFATSTAETGTARTTPSSPTRSTTASTRSLASAGIIA
jgi:hypothetical protein